ncbi:DUF7926 domain-containing protein [Actinomyces howellii]|uniref:Gram-positive cocci surface proteins LPxTG domain-containing protein n=1 Tax=Actinomyces howellii TaxID=52771 RepID=A0A448HJH5_9ACTO|nr:DUF5979 domain-containing protein [Actinomyces howellii]VEG29676.1 Uncharacterised protein [Actinomyces howellii]
MTVNGSQTVSVDLPGTGGISGVVPTTYVPLRLSKMSSVIGPTSSMVWEVNFGTPYITQQLAAAGTPITVDGSIRQTITFTDTLGPGQAFSTDMSRWAIMVRNSAAEPSLTGIRVTNAAGTDLNTTSGDFDMSVSIDGQVATITVTGPFAENTNYKITYPVTFTSQSGTASVGVHYENTAALDGTAATASFERNYVESFKVTVDMAAGYGGFEVLKTLTGSGLDSVPAGTTFDVTVDYTLPAAASVYAAEGWTAPGTLNADGTTGSTTMKVVIGRTSTYPGTFPKGTVVSLCEDTSSASPASAGYSWGTPVFKVGSTATSTLTVGDQTSTAVSLTNTATALGTFEVVKTASGAEGAAAKDYSFSYTCTDGQSGTVSAKGDGVAVPAGASFALGTECTLTEDEASAAIEGYTLSAPAAQTVTISSATTPVTATFTNSYTLIPTPTPTPTPTASESASESASAIPSESASAAPSESASAAPSESASAAPSESASAAPSESASAAPSESASAAPSESASATPTVSATASGSVSAGASESVVPSAGASSPGVVRAPAGGSTSGSAVSGGSSLARTGASVVVPGVLAVVALGGGGVLLRRRRRA